MTRADVALRRVLDRVLTDDGDPRWTPLFLWIVGLATIGLGLTDLWSLLGWFRMSPWIHVLTLTASCIAVRFKRRIPIITLGIGSAIVMIDFAFGGSIAVLIVFADLIFGAFRRGNARARQVVLSIMSLAIVGAAAWLWSIADLRVAVAGALQLSAFVIIPAWWARDLRQKERLSTLAAHALELERQRGDQLVRVAELDRQRAVQSERAEMARDLHDVVASHLSATALRAGAALARPADTEADRAALRTVRESSLAGLSEMRSMILLLRGEADPERDPVAAPPRLERVSELVGQAEDNGLTVRFTGEVVTVPAAVDQTAYRIIAEALVNAAKHAPESTVQLTIEGSDPLLIKIENDLDRIPSADDVVLPPALSAGLGLAGIRDRTAALGGHLSAGPTERGTWLVEASIPARGSDDRS